MMNEQVLKPVSPLTSVWVDKEDNIMNKKQSSIDFLIEQIEIILKLNNIQLNAGYKIHTILPIIEKLKAMHKEEIMDAFQYGKWDWHEHLQQGTLSKDPAEYYNETFGGR